MEALQRLRGFRINLTMSGDRKQFLIFFFHTLNDLKNLCEPKSLYDEGHKVKNSLTCDILSNCCLKIQQCLSQTIKIHPLPVIANNEDPKVKKEVADTKIN